MISSLEFNGLPTFFDATETAKEKTSEVKAIGEIINSHGLIEIFGCFLLHRHYDLEPNEKIVRYMSEFGCLSTPTKNAPPDAVPISWCVDTTSSHDISALEFALVDDNGYESMARQVLGDLHSVGLAKSYGIYRLDCVPRSNMSLFETSDEDLRISVVSRWNDSTHPKNRYIQSTYSFCHSDQEGVVDIDSNTGILCADTQYCQGCAPSSPLLQAVVSRMRGSDSSTTLNSGSKWANELLQQFAKEGERLVSK